MKENFLWWDCYKKKEKIKKKTDKRKEMIARDPKNVWFTARNEFIIFYEPS